MISWTQTIAQTAKKKKNIRIFLRQAGTSLQLTCFWTNRASPSATAWDSGGCSRMGGVTTHHFDFPFTPNTIAVFSLLTCGTSGTDQDGSWTARSKRTSSFGSRIAQARCKPNKCQKGFWRAFSDEESPRKAEPSAVDAGTAHHNRRCAIKEKAK